MICVHMRRTDFLGSYQMHSTAKFTIFAMNFIQKFIHNNLHNHNISFILMGDDPMYSIEMLKFVKTNNVFNKTTMLSMDATIEQNLRNAKKELINLSKKCV